jgi:hypothetical protein
MPRSDSFRATFNLSIMVVAFVGEMLKKVSQFEEDVHGHRPPV